MRAVALVCVAMVGLGSAALVVTPIIPKEDQLVSRRGRGKERDWRGRRGKGRRKMRE